MTSRAPATPTTSSDDLITCISPVFPSPCKGEDEGEGPCSARSSRAIQDSASFSNASAQDAQGFLSNRIPHPIFSAQTPNSVTLPELLVSSERPEPIPTPHVRFPVPARARKKGLGVRFLDHSETRAVSFLCRPDEASNASGWKDLGQRRVSAAGSGSASPHPIRILELATPTSTKDRFAISKPVPASLARICPRSFTALAMLASLIRMTSRQKLHQLSM